MQVINEITYYSRPDLKKACEKLGYPFTRTTHNLYEKNGIIQKPKLMLNGKDRAYTKQEFDEAIGSIKKNYLASQR